ncbi:hypothetical protein ACUN24_09705 [Pedobacter sp. WC2501]
MQRFWQSIAWHKLQAKYLFFIRPRAKGPNMKQTIKKEMENITDQLKKAN